MENSDFEKMSMFECYNIYNPASYYSLIRGLPCYWVQSLKAYSTDEKARRAALVALLSVKYRLVFDEPMVFNIMPEGLFQELKREVLNKHYTDYGLKQMFVIVGNDQDEVELQKIPSVRYTTNVNVVGQTDKLAYQDCCSGKINYSGWGKIVEFGLPDNYPDEIVPLVEVPVHPDEEEVVETTIQGFVERPIDVMIVVPKLSEVTRQIGWSGASSVEVTVKTPESGVKTVELYGDTPAIVHFKCNSVYTATYVHRVKYTRKWQRDMEAELDFRDIVYQSKFMKVYRDFMTQVSEKMLRVRKANGGWTKLSIKIYDLLRHAIFPVMMPSSALMALCMSIVKDDKIIWEDRDYSWYNGANRRYYGENTFEECLMLFPLEHSIPEYAWDRHGPMTYEQFESTVKYDRRAKFQYYDDDMDNDYYIQHQHRLVDLEERTLNDVSFIESDYEQEEFEYSDLDYFESELLGD